ncbi:MAG: PIN domain protein [Actinobacteria bacterium]|nr:PIN domain protein [Actinomycetota bacterium]
MIIQIYTDTSVFGGCFDLEFKKWSCKLIDEFMIGEKIVAIADLTLKELEKAPLEVRNLVQRIPEKYKKYLLLEEEAKELAQYYIEDGAIDKSYLIDAQHIAIATVNRVDVLVSWNFKHIVNLNKIRLYNSVNLKCGYPLLEIRSPLEVSNEK